MARYCIVFLMLTLFFKTAVAQKDTAVYYLKESGKLVSIKDSADYFLVILPPDASVNPKIYVVKEYYPDGKIKLTGGSNSNKQNFHFEGPVIEYYENRHRKKMETMQNGEPMGDVVEYYPNGMLYCIISYAGAKKRFLRQCNDSTGNILTENGNGKWVEYNENFSRINESGEVKGGALTGMWHGIVNDSVNFEKTYEFGQLTSYANIYKRKANTVADDICTAPDHVPEFPGGLKGYSKFLSQNINYPGEARRKGIQGLVIVNFVVERNGALSNIQLLRGIGGGCDDEAIRVIKLSSPWKPGLKNGQNVRVSFSAPINFTLSQRN